MYCDGVEESHDKESSNKYPGGWIYSHMKGGRVKSGLLRRCGALRG